MAKKINQPELVELTFEDIKDAFDSVGGSIHEEEDSKIVSAINDLPGSEVEKLELVIRYARELERANHYLRR